MSDGIEVTYQGGLDLPGDAGLQRADDPYRRGLRAGGRGEAFSPSDLVAAAVATCVMTIMSMIAQRNQVELAGMTADCGKGTGEVLAHWFDSRDDPHSRAGITPTVRSKLEAAVDKCLVNPACTRRLTWRLKCFGYERSRG